MNKIIRIWNNMGEEVKVLLYLIVLLFGLYLYIELLFLIKLIVDWIH